MFDVEAILQAGGLIAIGLIVFAESGLLVGFILPGDTLLLAAGFYAAQDKLPLPELLAVVIITAIVGYQVGYIIGERAGPATFKREKGLLFRREYLDRANKFFAKWGKATVVLARFIAHVRTFIPVIAGAGKMDKKQFFAYNVSGALLWGGGITLLGYWLGNKVGNLEHYLLPGMVGLLTVIYVFVFWQLLRSPERRRNLRRDLKDDWVYLFGSKK